ncbi:MAG TPA: hypothetical protein P5096_02795 [Patescibacteria group bacterium]|nr:hypothetical protein [Patescibacteria group bacterium]
MKNAPNWKTIITITLISSCIIISLALLPGCIQNKEKSSVPIVDDFSQAGNFTSFSFCHAERRLPEVRIKEGWLICETLRKAHKVKNNDHIFIIMERNKKGVVVTTIMVKRKTVRYPLYYLVLKSRGKDKESTISLADALVKAILP